MPKKTKRSFDELELLSYLLDEGDLGQQAKDSIVPRDQNREIPLSYAQQRLWFLDQFDPDLIAYNMPFAYRLRGYLNQAALIQSLNEIVQRHESFRTTLKLADNKPVQVIRSELEIPIETIDFQYLPKNEREPKALESIKTDLKEFSTYQKAHC